MTSVFPCLKMKLTAAKREQSVEVKSKLPEFKSAY